MRDHKNIHLNGGTLSESIPYEVGDKIMTEVWKQLKECNKYEISNKGTVRNIETGCVRYVECNTAGYLRVAFGRKKYFVHRLVASYFCDGYFDGAVVNHKDFNKLNNSATNLEWVSRSSNSKHAYINGHQPGSFQAVKRTIRYNNKVYEDITIKDFTKMFGICKSTFFNWLSKGLVSYVSNDYPEKE